jgi:hypothetical protein
MQAVGIVLVTIIFAHTFIFVLLLNAHIYCTFVFLLIKLHGVCVCVQYQVF